MAPLRRADGVPVLERRSEPIRLDTERRRLTRLKLAREINVGAVRNVEQIAALRFDGRDLLLDLNSEFDAAASGR
jgi:hypothetical protein